jgi:ankyrin repeat protein
MNKHIPELILKDIVDAMPHDRDHDHVGAVVAVCQRLMASNQLTSSIMRNALYIAVARNLPLTAKTLITQFHASPFYDTGKSAIHLMIKNKLHYILKMVVDDNKTAVMNTIHAGLSPLSQAVLVGDTDAIQILDANAESVCSHTIENVSPLEWAMQTANNPAIVRTLIKNLVLTPYQREVDQAIMRAIRMHKLANINALFASPIHGYRGALSGWCYAPEIGAVMSPMHLAIYYNHLDIVQALLHHGFPVTYGQPSTANQIFNGCNGKYIRPPPGALPPPPSSPPPPQLIEEELPCAQEWSVEDHVDHDVIDEHRVHQFLTPVPQSCLAFAVLLNKPSIAAVLIDHKGDVAAPDDFGNTPLATAIYFNYDELVSHLLALPAVVPTIGLTNQYGEAAWAIARHRDNQSAATAIEALDPHESYKAPTVTEHETPLPPPPLQRDRKNGVNDDDREVITIDDTTDDDGGGDEQTQESMFELNTQPNI